MMLESDDAWQGEKQLGPEAWRQAAFISAQPRHAVACPARPMRLQQHETHNRPFHQDLGLRILDFFGMRTRKP